jgi:2-phosphosulfolactate phosphatase
MLVAVRHFSPGLDFGEAEQIVAIDVLRATSVIVTALAHGARGVVPVDSVEAARKAATRHERPFLGGERANRRIEGFDAGNSPSEYVGAGMTGATVILATTNGTRALAAAAQLPGRSVSAAAFFNVHAIVNHLAAGGGDVLLLCAGTDGRFSLEDALCAGAIAHRLQARGSALDDEALAAAELYAARKHDLPDFIARGSHARRLTAQGFGEDVIDAAAIDRYDIVPLLDGEMLKARVSH